MKNFHLKYNTKKVMNFPDSYGTLNMTEINIAGLNMIGRSP